MAFHKQEATRLRSLWRLIDHESRIFADYSQLEDFVRSSGNFVYLSDGGAIAILGRWRQHLSSLAIWEIVPAAASRVPTIRELVDSLESEGFSQLLSPLLPEEGRRPYIGAGFRELETIAKMEKKDFNCPAVTETACILPAEERHLQALVELERQTFPPFWQLGKGNFRQFLRGHHFLVALLNEGVVGYNIDSILGVQGTISRLGVHPDFQSRGIGSQLLARAVRWFQDQRVRSIVLTTQKENLEGQKLYRKFGFVALKGSLYILAYDY